MKKHRYIKKLEKSQGVLSKMDYHDFSTDLYKHFEEKHIQVYAKSKVLHDGKIIWLDLIYKTRQPFYLHFRNLSKNTPKWGLTIYYKSEQINELIIFIRQVLNSFRNTIDPEKQP
jgi:hypothetical protein